MPGVPPVLPVRAAISYWRLPDDTVQHGRRGFGFVAQDSDDADGYESLMR